MSPQKGCPQSLSGSSPWAAWPWNKNEHSFHNVIAETYGQLNFCSWRSVTYILVATTPWPLKYMTWLHTTPSVEVP